jgi:hypothetical protein
MAQAQWYELRVLGSAGTSSEIAGSIAIAISENGRLCSISSGDAKRFETEQAAMDYLFVSTVPRYRFEAVRCGSSTAAHLGR